MVLQDDQLVTSHTQECCSKISVKTSYIGQEKKNEQTYQETSILDRQEDGVVY